MKIYLVGGAVRDELLGQPIKERDWVVVGATISEMLQLGYKQVGKEFPVFIHPRTNEEYALARMERKTKPGYQGFTFDTSADVTLEDDLRRRDLTINAMAKTVEAKLIDPYHGKEDLDNKILRHVSAAFVEDPVRILRVGRFLARYAHLGFYVAPETIELMKKMVGSGEVNALVAERVWKELERTLTEKNPEKFFEVLADAHALAILFPHLEMNSIAIETLKIAVKNTSDTTVRFAALLYALPELKILYQRYRIPNHYRELTTLVVQHHQQALHAPTLSADELLELLTRLDIFRREKRFKNFLLVCQIIAIAQELHFDPNWLNHCATLAKSIDIQALITQGLTGNELAQALKEKRRKKIAQWLAR